jgi:D-arabinose 1-dehydrogenase-like Zn-dependent alcohol dehydrogenase
MAHQVYMPVQKGPFRCDHCEYYRSTNRCDNSTIIGYATLGKFGLSLVDGKAKVDPGGCSDEYEPKT